MKDRRFQEVLAKYDGDIAKYEAAMDAEGKQVADGSFGGDEEAALENRVRARSDTIYWQDMVEALTILPDLETAAHQLIVDYLGYLPPERTRYEFEPFIRTLIHTQRQGQVSESEFDAQLRPRMTELRNADIHENGWIVEYRPRDFDRYETYLPQCKQAARERVVAFIGYEPELDRSVGAELWLRERMMRDDAHFADDRTQDDSRAITVVAYREAWITQGADAANASPLMGVKGMPDEQIC